tara:strand:+ start:147 stop:551 length:405 start_codon:yes stop_codon:yes gene_type:complete
MAYFPNNPNGQATSADSAPVVLSSNQSPSLVAQDDTLVLLARILKNIESLSIVDSAQRLKITIDSATAGITLGTVAVSSMPTTTVTGTVAVNINAGANVIGSVNNLATIAGMDREMYINQARTAYNTGISAKLN